MISVADQKQVPEHEGVVPRNRSTDEERLDVRITPIQTEGASQCTCHNPCM